MFEYFKKNIEIEKEIINKLKTEKDKKKLVSYVNILKILNLAVPEFLKKTSNRNPQSNNINLVSVKFSNTKGNIFIRKEDKNFFEKEIKKISLNEENKSSESHSSVKPSLIKNISNRMFRSSAEKLLPSLNEFSQNIKKANLNLLPSTYLAITLFFTFFSIFLGILIYSILFLLNPDYWTYFWIIPLTPIIVFAGFYFYPKIEAGGVQKEITYELPFVTIYMTAIASSNIEPTRIFEIIAKSKEYPTIGKEMQKILVLIKVYGYDLVTSLKNVASRTSNPNLSELLGGMATNISGGGALKDYLRKKAQNYLLDYQLERKKYTEIASTFMDIYISILIAAPMVLMLMFIIMNVAGLGFEGYSIEHLMIISIFVIIIVNILFIIAINLKQPKV